MFISDLSKTIIAPSTPPGFGAISIIRLSGKNAFSIASKFLYPKKKFINLKTKQTYILKVMENGKLIDQVVSVFYKGPKSYTGDNIVEIFCHGSPYIIRKILTLAIKEGAREAEPGEFTMRGFVNGKMDLTQAEAVNDLIHSESSSSHSSAISHLRGEISGQIKDIKMGILNLLSEIEVRLDDSEEEMPEINFKNFLWKTKKIISPIQKLAESFEKGKFIKNGFKTSIIGIPNSGKSSLLNALLGYKRAIVTKISGTTTDTIEEKIDFSGISFVFTDTAGVKMNTKNPIEKEGIVRAIDFIKTSDIIIWVMDYSKKTCIHETEVARKIEKHLDTKKTQLIKVFNKSDLKHARPVEKGILPISCKKDTGIEKLKKLIVKRQEAIFGEESSAIITSMRHYQALNNSLTEMELFEKMIENKKIHLELAAEHLKSALNELSNILGETNSDELLSNIFSKFCVGK
ncbi:MAG: tRNA uridine-5-carboxymethylaminomethyl(34) synthesis GTPase MnmE [Elusimicrobiota bacterium]|nr:tRNA uridine-5-carboxymethylaminomethyl(34) synthesis GTPase MnmE [Elusimicrobiota bacterium]